MSARRLAFPLGSRHHKAVDFACAGIAQDSSGSRQGRPGRSDVVEQEDTFPSKAGGGPECTFKICGALLSVEATLSPRRSNAAEGTSVDGKLALLR